MDKEKVVEIKKVKSKGRLLKRILLITSVTLVLLVGTVFVVLYNIGDRILEEAINSQLSEALSDEALAAAENDESSGQADQDAVETQPNPGTDSQIAPADETPKPEMIDAGEPADTGGPADVGEENVSKPAKATPKPPKKVVKIPVQKVKEIKEQISPTDKVEAAALVIKRLSKEDIDTLTQLLSGGITAEEKEKAKEIMFSRFTEEEITRIKEMYIKYMQDGDSLQ